MGSTTGVVRATTGVVIIGVAVSKTAAESVIRRFPVWKPVGEAWNPVTAGMVVAAGRAPVVVVVVGMPDSVTVVVTLMFSIDEIVALIVIISEEV